jgi:hypothetical protein
LFGLLVLVLLVLVLLLLLLGLPCHWDQFLMIQLPPLHLLLLLLLARLLLPLLPPGPAAGPLLPHSAM